MRPSDEPEALQRRDAGEEWERSVTSQVRRRVGVEDVGELREMLGDVADPEALRYVESLEPSSRDAGAESALDDLVPDEDRRRAGVYFTPEPLAERMAGLVDSPARDAVVLDLCCGDGVLLEAVVRARPDATVIGVEREPVLAVAAAARIVAERGAPHPGDRIICGDGLARLPELDGAAAVLGNPPYVREKGNRELFRAVREQHADLRQYFGARIDLHYLFLHRALDHLCPGGQLIYLTSEYWLTASGAARLRSDLSSRSRIEGFERLGDAVFESAPGHHSLLLSARRTDSPDEQPVGVEDGEPWTPFATGERLEGPPLSDFLHDRQGFVSGADRATRAVRKKLPHPVDDDAPIYIWRRHELPRGQRDLFEPLVRRSDCVANQVCYQSPGDEYVLWADGSEDALRRGRIEGLLEPFREALEARREAREGRMPWYRIWWPRDPEDYSRPKLVVPRRSETAEFCLDLSGSYVSSDCTFLTVREGLDPIPTLLAAMLVLNSEPTVEHLRQYGKTKGKIIEFYSDPLQRLPLAVERHGDHLVPRDPAIRARWKELLRDIRDDGVAERDVVQ